ncbi:MAG: hypothetical protein FHK82_03160 [Sedimenticola thiotaurini]|uniref:Uncharacterized protein n=1 Tax=Sedimenticola thiotaurini TaxID=1543721 RepID=A0A558DG28_9GAMM|nr:MAG: hypothetical protein FHK82_03160 [Sedimenticola thiotaurini]
MSWHDVHVHGFRLVEGEHGAGELVLDIDYILEWLRDEESFRFRIAPATLQFHQISNLRFYLDYATPTIGIVPFSLNAITRAPATYRTGYKTFRWNLEINCPVGECSFECPGFTQTLRAPEQISNLQRLLPSERGEINGV